jgi:hypothetical protein
MAKTLAEAQAKYARKTQNAAGKWEANTRGSGDRWAQGLSAFGVTPGPQSRAAFDAGVAAASYKPGDPNKWAEGMRRGLSR